MTWGCGRRSTIWAARSSTCRMQRHLAAAREQSLAFLYWMQTEAPRHDGGVGYPGLRLRPDVTGTADGLAQAPYIRESRRLRAATTVREQDVSLAVRGEAGATPFRDTVGVGMYRIDLHPGTRGTNYVDVACCPFEIPLGMLLPQRLTNLLVAGKNVGSTHITNGCYRLHPVEWNIGEAAGTLAARCVRDRVTPHQAGRRRAARRVPGRACRGWRRAALARRSARLLRIGPIVVPARPGARAGMDADRRAPAAGAPQRSTRPGDPAGN